MTSREEEAPFRFPYSVPSADYIDLSQQMIDQMNEGHFDKCPTDENVNMVSFDSCVFRKQPTPIPLLCAVFTRHPRSPQRRTAPYRRRRYHQGTYEYPCF